MSATDADFSQGAPEAFAGPQQPPKKFHHPVTVFFFLFWKISALLLYLLLFYFYKNFVVVFVVVVLSIAFDFWTTKNIAGRLMVGLRWWNEVHDDGSSVWRFESLDDKGRERLNRLEGIIFWSCLILAPVVWGFCLLTCILSVPPKIDWMVIVIIGIALNGSNLVGYIKCARDARKKVKSLAVQYAAQALLSQTTASSDMGPSHRLGPLLPLLVLLVLLCWCARGQLTPREVAERCAQRARPNEVVVGQTTGRLLVERGVTDGLRAALAEASQLTSLQYTLRSLNHTSRAEMLENVRRLVEDECAFMLSGVTCESDDEAALLAALQRYSVPLVGAMSTTDRLRTVNATTATFERTGITGRARNVTLPVVVNIRASGGDELNAILSSLSQDWDALSALSLVLHDTDLGRFALGYVNAALRRLTGNNTSAATATTIPIDQEGLARVDMRRVVAGLLRPARPRAIIMCTLPVPTAAFLESLAHDEAATGVAVYALSWNSEDDLDAHLSGAAKSLLASRNVTVRITESVPDPRQRAFRSIALIRRFQEARTPRSTYSTLEGYLIGWFVYEAAQQTIARSGLPLTRAGFLSTVFEDVRTFNVLGMTLGPYGDGGGRGMLSTQSSGDACNQGVHEVFMTNLLMPNCTQAPDEGSSLKFAGCTAPRWSTSGSLTLVGSLIEPEQEARGLSVRTGLLAALNMHNSEASNVVMLRSSTGGLAHSLRDLKEGNVSAVVSPWLDNETANTLFEDYALISPMPVFNSLCRPFIQGVINLFPTACDEMVAATKFFMNKSITHIEVLFDGSPYANDCKRCIEEFIQKNKTYNTTHYSFTSGVKRASEYVLSHVWEREAFLMLGGAVSIKELSVNVTAANSNLTGAAMLVLNSQVAIVHGRPSEYVKTRTVRLSVSPPISRFASTSALRTEYTTWVSSTDTDDTSFQNFFVGKFLSMAIDEAKTSDPDGQVTAKKLLAAVYRKSSFTIEGITIGPFRNTCSNKRDCCNQGLSTVYVTTPLTSAAEIARFHHIGDCGRDYLPAEKPSTNNDDVKLGVGLGVGLGGALLICTAVLALVVWRTRRTVEFFIIQRGEIELGKCLGQGRFGAMYMADWHGTTVAVRMIDKKATPKEDQRLIKEEVLLLHKHHHPNLLMLMGYCETRNELLVVTEYMDGGTLADYLRREKRYADVYSLVAMAFDVLKGIAYLHSCKPPIVHGSICTQNLLLDGRGMVKVSDFWYSSKRGAFSSSGSGRSLKRAAWQPPEVIAGTFLTPATDVYAFGIVLWELIAPPDMTLTSSSASGTASEGRSSVQSGATPGASGMLSVGLGGVVEMRNTQLGPPEIPPNASPEVADLLERCWLSQPERRPSIFQILRNWPTTFATLGAFEIPPELNPPSVGAAGPFSHHSQHSSNGSHNRSRAGDSSGDDMAASMVSFMPIKMDSVALQVPQEPDVGLCAVNQLAAAAAAPSSAPERSRAGSLAAKSRSPQGSEDSSDSNSNSNNRSEIDA
eukprot:m51a1_g8846 putative golgi apparatus membrane protein tvp23 homolog b-like (1492) ;mRNA; r:470165-476907